MLPVFSVMVALTSVSCGPRQLAHTPGAAYELVERRTSHPAMLMDRLRYQDRRRPRIPRRGDVCSGRGFGSELASDGRRDQDRLQAEARPVEPGPDRALADHELLGDLGEPQVLVVVGEDDVAPLRGELAERAPNL